MQIEDPYAYLLESYFLVRIVSYQSLLSPYCRVVCRGVSVCCLLRFNPYLLHIISLDVVTVIDITLRAKYQMKKK
jgi:hypothetical protein